MLKHHSFSATCYCLSAFSADPPLDLGQMLSKLNHSGPVALKKNHRLMSAEALASDFQAAAARSTLAMCRCAGVRTRGAGPCSAEMLSELRPGAAGPEFAFLRNAPGASPDLVLCAARGNEQLSRTNRINLKTPTIASLCKGRAGFYTGGGANPAEAVKPF